MMTMHDFPTAAAQVACDGAAPGTPPMHPKIYLELQRDLRASCPYCSRVFVFDTSAPEAMLSQ